MHVPCLRGGEAGDSGTSPGHLVTCLFNRQVAGACLVQVPGGSVSRR